MAPYNIDIFRRNYPVITGQFSRNWVLVFHIKIFGLNRKLDFSEFGISLLLSRLNSDGKLKFSCIFVLKDVPIYLTVCFYFESNTLFRYNAVSRFVHKHLFHLIECADSFRISKRPSDVSSLRMIEYINFLRSSDLPKDCMLLGPLFTGSPCHQGIPSKDLSTESNTFNSLGWKEVLI